MADTLDITVAALVGLGRRDLWEIRLPGVSKQVFRGPSLAELLDDAALHIMEEAPRYAPAQLERLLLSPEVTLRRTEVETRLAFGDARKKTEIKVKLTAVCTRWAKEGFWRVVVPRLSMDAFAVRNLGQLADKLGVYLEEWAKTHSLQALERAASTHREHLELIDVEIEVPSLLPSRRPRREREGGKPASAPVGEERKWRPATELRAVGINLLQRARDGRLEGALGRDGLVDDLVQQVATDGAAILLVGPSGVGKTAILEAVASRLAAQGGTLQERTDVWRVDGARLIAGMSMVGQWEGRLARVVHELYHRRDVLVVDDLPSLAWTGRSAQSDTTMADYLVPHLQRGELTVLAECTPERLAAGRLENPGFFSCFRVIHVAEMDAAATQRVLLQKVRRTEAERGLAVRAPTFDALVTVASRFGPRLAEPGRSVRVLRRFLADVRPEKLDRYGRRMVEPEDVFVHTAATTGLPRFLLEPGQGRSAAAIEAWFERRIVGQPTAVAAATDVVACLQQGLDDPERPVSTLLFVGPTGVGKTETAKALAAYLFGDARKLVRFDMSEVNGPGAVARLVGGSGRPDGDLTRAVANQPFCVVLLDEIEKAGSQVFDLLLQVLGEGRLTNAAGHTTDFRNTVIVMTSNLGVAGAQRRTGFDRASVGADASHYTAAAQAFFRPELYNRIDRIVPFRSLGRADVEPLVERTIGRVLGRRGLRRAGVVVALHESVRDWLGEVGFDPVYGARSLQRVVERELTVPLARMLIERPSVEGGAHIALWRAGEELGLALTPLEDAVSDGPSLDACTDWEAMNGLHARLVQLHGRIAQHPHWAAVEAARTGLLEQLPGLDEDAWDRLETTSAILDEHSALASSIEDFESDWLARYRFEDGVSKVRGEPPRKVWGKGTRERLVTQEVVVPVDRGRHRLGAARRLAELEEQLASVIFRVESWGPPSSVVLRFQPLHQEAATFALELAEAFQEAWSGWGRVASWRRVDTWAAGELAAGACALVFRVPGMARLFETEVGLHLDAQDVGADRLLRLVDVVLLAGEPDAVLRAMDAELDAVAVARIAGEDVTVDLPRVVRRYGAVAGASDVALAELPADLRTRALRKVVR